MTMSSTFVGIFIKAIWSVLILTESYIRLNLDGPTLNIKPVKTTEYDTPDSSRNYKQLFAVEYKISFFALLGNFAHDPL
jgi:hypothetical protein